MSTPVPTRHLLSPFIDSSGAYSDDAYTMTVNVNSVQDSPTGDNEEVTTDEDTDYTFAESDFTL